MKFEGQLLQDRWVIEQVTSRFGSPQAESGGFTFVDVGAHDGKHMSNTVTLETEYGWTGICIEPHPESYEQLKENRKCKTENVCAGSVAGVVDFVLSDTHAMLSGQQANGSRVVAANVETLDAILTRNKVNRVTYMSIDTEGSECEVLKGLTILQPFCLTIEHNGDDEKAAWACDWLMQRNYLCRVVKWDIFAVKDVADWGVIVS